MSNSLIHQKINELKSELLEYNKNEVSLNISDLEHIDKDSFLYYFLRDYGFVDWSKIMDLLDGESGKKIYSKSHVLFKEKSKLILREINVIKNFSCKINNLDKKLTLENGAYLSFKDVEEVEKDNFNIITVDKGKLKLPLELRYFNHGDSFSPFGMNGTKKVGKFLKDNGVNECKIEGKESNEWKLVDGIDLIVHIFHPEKRKFYELEKMWSELIPKEKLMI